MRGRSVTRRDRGFALALAVCVLVAVTLAVALILDGAIAAFRSARADLEMVRAEAVAETALAAALDARLDAASLGVPGGTTLAQSSTGGGGGSVTTTIQAVSGPVVRVVVRVHRSVGVLRLSVGLVAFGRIVADSAYPGDARIALLRGPWWAPIQ